MNLVQPFTQIPNVKVMINIGSLLDIPTGTYMEGMHGEHILNGGLGNLTGIVGIGNSFKSTIMHYQMLTAMSRMTGSSANTYDTEINIHESNLRKFYSRIPEFKNEDILQTGRWVITDKTIYYANVWYQILKDFLNEKKKNASKILRDTPFKDRSGIKHLQILTPTFTEIDSFSEFETEDVAEIQNKNELGDSGGNTIHMRQGLAKQRFLMEIPTLFGSSYNYTFLSAHIGKTIVMDTRAPPVKKLQHLKNGDVIKGATDKFTFNLNNCWHCYNAAPLINDTTKGPEYPRDSDDKLRMDTDLNTVILRQLRSKSGPSGMAIELIVSQSEGVLPSLTEFHYIKSCDRFGLNGTLQNYELDLLPGLKLSRTTVRSKIDDNPKLRRSLNITSELCQMHALWHHLDEGFLCTPKELYESIKALGYDWELLYQSRGWWALDNDPKATPFLSTYDLLNMRICKYHPYWYPIKKEDLKPIK
jgi:hypothetical protein